MKISRASAAIRLATLTTTMIVAPLGTPQAAHAQTTGFNQTGAGPFDYNTTGNWVGGTINGIWNSDLTLTGTQNVTFGANTVLTTGLTFNHGGNFALTLRGDGGNRSLTLGGDIAVNTSGGTTANVTLGGGSNQNLNINLGGAVRNISIAADRTLTLSNVVSNGGITKTGSGTLVLVGANTFASGLTLNEGTLSFGNGGAWGTGAFTINGGFITSGATRSNGNNNVQFWNGDFSHIGSSTMDLGTGAVTINGNRTVTVAASTLTVGGAIGETGGNRSLTKAGAGTLVLNGASTYSGGTAVNEGTLSIGAAGTLGADVTGNNVTVSGGILQLAANSNIGANQTLTVGSTSTALGGVGMAFNALPANLAQSGAAPILIAINTLGFDAITDQSTVGNGFVFLGSNGIGSLASTTLGAGTDGVYRLGGGGGALIVTNGVINGAHDLIIGSTLTNGGGSVVLNGANSLTGTTLINTGSSLTLGGAAGSLASSALTANSGTSLTFDNSTAVINNRAASTTLQGAALAVVGNASANANNAITGALTIGNNSSWGNAAGSNTVTVVTDATHTRLTANSLVRADSGAVFFRGTNLGANTIASATAGSTNIVFTNAPTAQLIGGGGTSGAQTISILPWAVGSTSATGVPTAFVTYDANGIRPLTEGEFATSITAGTTTANNVKLNGASPLTVTGTATINSLFLNNTAVSNTTVTVLAGTGALTITSGAIYADLSLGGNNNALTVSKQVEFGTAQGVIGTLGTPSNSKTLVFSGGIGGSGGLMIYDTNSVSSTQAGVNISAATTYTGDTIINGSLIASNTNALANFSHLGRTGDVYVNGTLGLAINGGTVRINGLWGSGRILTPFTSSTTLSVGDNNATSTFDGIITEGSGTVSLTKVGTGTLTLTGTNNTQRGATSIQNGTLSVVTLNSVAAPNATSTLGRPVTVSSGTIGLGSSTTTGTLRVTGTGETTDRVINLVGTTGGGAIEQAGSGLLKFTSNFTATGNGSKTLTLSGSTAGTGEIAGAIVDNSATNKTSVYKTGSGTWTLSGANTYTGATTVNQGRLILGAANALASSSPLILSGGTFDTGGFNQSLGTLTLSATSIIDLGTGSSALAFADSSGVAWGSSISLSFINFTDGVDRIRIGTTSSGLTGTQLSQITINGLAAVIDANGYLTSAVPEPSAYALLAGASLLSVALVRRKNNRRHAV